MAPVRAWMRTGARRAVAGALLVAHVAGTALVCLPISPVGSAGYLVAVAANPDVGETVGWDRLQAQVAAAAAATGRPGPAAVLTANYGEAGALDRYRRHGGAVPPVYSGHNGYGEWGPPPAGAESVLVVGWFGEKDLNDWFGDCRQVATIRTGVDNSENGAGVRLCAAPRRAWSALWNEIRHNG